jgi:hypothetical protein
MIPSRRALSALVATLAAAGTLGASTAAAAAAIAATAATSTPATSAPAKPHRPSARERALLHSHELWATIDVCDPADQPDTVGVRGSMPGDGNRHDRMYMSFRLQYESASGHWTDLAGGASAGWVPVGSGASARQGGSSFELKPVADKPAVTLRGVVDFQWRHGKKVVMSAARPTSAAHKSLAGADPPKYSAATCVFG